MKTLSRVCIVLLYLPAIWAVGPSGSLSINNIRKNSLFATVVVIAYWSILVMGLVLITIAYLGK